MKFLAALLFICSVSMGATSTWNNKPVAHIFASAMSPTAYSQITTSSSFVTVSGSGISSGRILSGLAITPTTANDMSLKIASLPAGTYMVIMHGTYQQLSSGFSCSWRIFDGTNVIAAGNVGLTAGGAISGMMGVWTYSTPQTNIEFKVHRFKRLAGFNVSLEIRTAARATEA